MKKKILICGATGFIGKNLTEFFSKDKDYDVTAVYHDKLPEYNLNVKWVHADLNNQKDVEKVIDGMDIVLQYAATTSGAGDIVNRPYIHVTDNAVMNSLILRQCYESGVKQFVFPSCTVMYQPSDTALTEEDYDGSKQILHNYFGVGNTKIYIEKMCEFYSRLGKTKHTILRQSNIYGPHDKYDLKRSHVFGATVTKVMTNEDGILEVWGTGEEKRDLLHISDLVTAVKLSIENQKDNFSVFNIGIGEDISINDLVNKMIFESKKNITIKHNLDKPTIKTNLFLNCKKAKDQIGWAPNVDIDMGIKMTLKWYRNNILKEQ